MNGITGVVTTRACDLIIHPSEEVGYFMNNANTSDCVESKNKQTSAVTRPLCLFVLYFKTADRDGVALPAPSLTHKQRSKILHLLGCF